MANGPGSKEGFWEMGHWSGVNRALSTPEKRWLYITGRKYVIDDMARIELNRWIHDRRRTRAHAEQICKRWGIEMPSREEIISLESDS